MKDVAGDIRPESKAPCANASSIKSVGRELARKPRPPRRGSRNHQDQVQIDARHLQKRIPDEKAEISPQQQELEDRQAHIDIPNPGEREFRAPGGRRPVPCRRLESCVVAPDADTDDIYDSDQQQLSETELRSRNADATARSATAERRFPGIRLRSWNCSTTRRMRRWTTSCTRINSGSPTRKRISTSTSSRKGTAALPPNDCPLGAGAGRGAAGEQRDHGSAA